MNQLTLKQQAVIAVAAAIIAKEGAPNDWTPSDPDIHYRCFARRVNKIVDHLMPALERAAQSPGTAL